MPCTAPILSHLLAHHARSLPNCSGPLACLPHGYSLWWAAFEHSPLAPHPVVMAEAELVGSTSLDLHW